MQLRQSKLKGKRLAVTTLKSSVVQFSCSAKGGLHCTALQVKKWRIASVSDIPCAHCAFHCAMQVILVKYPTRVHCTTSTVLHCTALHNELKSEGLPVSDSATSARASQHHQQIYFLLAKIIWNIHPSHILPIFTSFLPKSFHCHTCPWPYLASIYISSSHTLKINFLLWLPFSYHFHLIPLSILSCQKLFLSHINIVQLPRLWSQSQIVLLQILQYPACLNKNPRITRT